MQLEQAISVISQAIFLMTLSVFFLAAFALVNMGLAWVIIKSGRWIAARIKTAWNEPEKQILQQKIFKERPAVMPFREESDVCVQSK